MNRIRRPLIALLAIASCVWAEGEFPELEKISPEAEAALRGLEGTAFVARAKQLGEPGALVVLKRLQERAEANRSWTEVARRHIDDARERPLCLLLGELASPELCAAMARELEAHSLHPRLRIEVVIALASSRGPAAAPALAARALDGSEMLDVRRAALLRIHRFPVDVAALRPLLLDPRGNVDVLTAAVLSRAGHHEAPSLIVEGLRNSLLGIQLKGACEAAANKIVGREIKEGGSFTLRGGATHEELYKAIANMKSPHATVLAAWIEKNKPDTAFERRHRAYLASDRRKAELRTKDFEQIIASGEEFDLAAAVLSTGRSRRAIERDLARLNRLSALAREATQDLDQPERIIEALNRLLLRGRTLPDGGSDRTSFSLHWVLNDNRGDCLGWSLLYVSVCDRLGYPVYIVQSPNHCFVRWDDGKTRRNIEPTARGKELPDEHYFEADGEHPFFLKRASRRRVLAAFCTNVSGTLANEGYFEGAERWADKAIKLDPDAYLAYISRAAARFETGAEPDLALKDIAASLALYAGTTEARKLRTAILLRSGRYKEAGEAAKTTQLRDTLTVCAMRTGDARGAKQEWLERLKEDGASLSAYAGLLEAKARLGEPLADTIERAKTRTQNDLAVTVLAAFALVEAGRDKEASELLLPIEQEIRATSKTYWSGQRETEFRHLTHVYWTQRARIALRAGDRAGAKAAIKLARKSYGPTREMIVVERELAE